jgi:hypothetical protein
MELDSAGGAAAFRRKQERRGNRSRVGGRLELVRSERPQRRGGDDRIRRISSVWYLARRELALAVLAEGDGRRPAGAAVERFMGARGDATSRFEAFLRVVSRDGDPDLAGLTVAVRELRAVVE